MSWAKPFGNGMSLFLVWNRNEDLVNDMNEGPHRVHTKYLPIIVQHNLSYSLRNQNDSYEICIVSFSWDSPINFCEGGAN